MVRVTAEESVLPRPVGALPEPAAGAAISRCVEVLEKELGFSAGAARVLAHASVDPSALRTAARSPEKLNVSGGVVLAVSVDLWARKVMPDPRNPRIAPIRKHPVGTLPGTDEQSRFRPVPEPHSSLEGRPEVRLQLQSAEQLSWALSEAKKFILSARGNDWRPSIRSLGVMTPVWVTLATLEHADETPDVVVPVTAEGSSRLTAVHDLLGIRSAEVPYQSDPRSLRNRIRELNMRATSPSADEATALRCEVVPALVLVGYRPYSDSDADFAAGVRSLVALRHIDPPKGWDEYAQMESIADGVIDELVLRGLITETEGQWYAGALTPSEAERHGFAPDPSVRAAAIVRLLTDRTQLTRSAVRAAITAQSTRQRVSDQLSFQIAAALIMRSVQEEGGRIDDIRRYLRRAFTETLAQSDWKATNRDASELRDAALDEIRRRLPGRNTLELAARAVYPLVTQRHLLGDLGAIGRHVQPDRRAPGVVIDKMRKEVRGVHQLAQAIEDFSARRPVRFVDEDGSLVLDDHGQACAVDDTLLRLTFPQDGHRVPSASTLLPRTPAETFERAIDNVGSRLDDLRNAVDALEQVRGQDGRTLVEVEGVSPADVNSWLLEIFKLQTKMPVWSARFSMAFGSESPGSSDAGDAEDFDDDRMVDDESGEDGAGPTL